jgi:phospholipid/cholesterol/gamma-HCH transport system substrate-binding protein
METRANYVLIGLFTLAVIVGAFGFVLWFQSPGGPGERTTYRVVFDGPVTGLRTGSPVVFNGIRVGEVTNLQLDPTDPRKVEASIAIDPQTPVRSDTRVTLDFQGLTGIASLSLRGGAPNAAPLARLGDAPPRLTADVSATQDLIQTVREAVRRVDAILATNEPVLRNALQNFETFTAALARNSDRIDRVMGGVEGLIGSPENPGELTLAARSFRQAATPIGELAESLKERSAELPELMASVRRLAENFDKRTEELPELMGSVRKLAQDLDTRTESVPELIASVRKFTGNLDQRMVEVPELVASYRKLAESLEERTAEVPKLVTSVRELAEKIDQRTAEVPELVNSIRNFADNLDKRTAEVPELVSSVRRFTDNLDKRTVELPELVTAMRNFADNVSKASADIPEMTASLKNFANTLDKRAEEIAASVTRLSNSGTRQIESLANDGRRTLATIDRAVRNFDRNPQRVIFGGSGNAVPEYNGRR